MDTQRPTASAIVSFAQRLEEGSRRFYEALAEAYPQGRETFLAFAKEAEKNSVLIGRAYHETVSDAIETGFSFDGLNLKDYEIEEELGIGVTTDSGHAEALKKALRLEELAYRFYSDVAERALSLLATMQRTFRKVAEIRNARMSKIQGMLEDLELRSLS
ncbi:MAG: hypothetical protein QW220_00380 [Candidatus Bathyarchaeia archaeon]